MPSLRERLTHECERIALLHNLRGSSVEPVNPDVVQEVVAVLAAAEALEGLCVTWGSMAEAATPEVGATLRIAAFQVRRLFPPPDAKEK